MKNVLIHFSFDESICSKMFHQNPERLNVLSKDIHFSVIEEEKHLKSNHIRGAGIREFELLS